MADIDHGDVLGREIAHDLKEPVRLALRQGGGGFIEEKDLHLARERLGDLNELALGHPEVTHATLGRYVYADARQVFARSLDGSADVDAAEAALLPLAEHHVLSHGHRGHEAQLLEHNPDAVPARDRGGPERYLATVDAHRPGVWADGARYNLHQRRLAGAVLPEQGMNLAAPDGKADIVVG
ncbi:MAG: hypothetical protein WD402_07585, partial [Chloroflexota bacterium]